MVRTRQVAKHERSLGLTGGCVGRYRDRPRLPEQVRGRRMITAMVRVMIAVVRLTVDQPRCKAGQGLAGPWRPGRRRHRRPRCRRRHRRRHWRRPRCRRRDCRTGPARGLRRHGYVRRGWRHRRQSRRPRPRRLLALDRRVADRVDQGVVGQVGRTVGAGIGRLPGILAREAGALRRLVRSHVGIGCRAFELVQRRTQAALLQQARHAGRAAGSGDDLRARPRRGLRLAAGRHGHAVAVHEAGHRLGRRHRHDGDAAADPDGARGRGDDDGLLLAEAPADQPEDAAAGVDGEIAGVAGGIVDETVDDHACVGTDRERAAVEKHQMRAVRGGSGHELVGLDVDADAQDAFVLVGRLAQGIAVGGGGDADRRARLGGRCRQCQDEAAQGGTKKPVGVCVAHGNSRAVVRTAS